MGAYKKKQKQGTYIKRLIFFFNRIKDIDRLGCTGYELELKATFGLKQKCKLIYTQT